MKLRRLEATLACAIACGGGAFAACEGAAPGGAGGEGGGGHGGWGFGGVAGAFGCDGGGGMEPDAGGCVVGDPTVTFHARVAPLLNACSGETCHLAPTYADLVGVPSSTCCDGRLLVAPGAPERSFLVDELEGHDLCGGSPMPLGGDPLTSSEIGAVRDWICLGALDD